MQHSGTVKSQIDMKTARKATIVNAPPGAWPAARRFAKGHLLLSQRPSFTRQKTVFYTPKDGLLQSVGYQYVTQAAFNGSATRLQVAHKKGRKVAGKSSLQCVKTA